MTGQRRLCCQARAGDCAGCLTYPGGKCIVGGYLIDITYHYPPELFALLVDAIPKLCKSKPDLLLFFRGSGVGFELLAPYNALLTEKKDEFNKYPVTRELLTKLNELGERTLRERREILKRVIEFDDFSVCWENDRAAARGLVPQIRDLVNVKDSFTRMRMEKGQEKQRRLQQQEATAKSQRERKANRDKIKSELFSLFGELDAHKRGKMLERVLNELFALYDILVREAFTIKGKCGEGVIEQIDELIELEGQLYMVEMKWWEDPIGVSEIAPILFEFVIGADTRERYLFPIRNLLMQRFPNVVTR